MFRGKFSGLPGRESGLLSALIKLLSASDKKVSSLFQKKLNISISDHIAISFYTSNKTIIFDKIKGDRNAAMGFGFPNADMFVS